MGCGFKYSKSCSTYKRYIAIGNNGYKGELCQDCLFWVGEKEGKMLKEIKARYATNCAKCKRDIREGWTVFFNPDNKEVYCKFCGVVMQKGEVGKVEESPDEQLSDKSDGRKLLDELVLQTKLNSDILNSLDGKIRDLTLDISHLDSYLRDTKKAASVKSKK